MRIAASLLLTAAASAQTAAPEILVSHHGRLLDGSDAPLDGTFDIAFRIYQLAQKPPDTAETPVWSETYSAPVHKGSYALLLGATDGGRKKLTAAEFPAGADRFLAIEVEGEGELSPRLRIGVVPYANSAARAVEAESALDADRLEGLTLEQLDERYAGAADYVRLQSTAAATAQTGHLALSGTARAGAFEGNGAGLSGLDAGALASGTVPGARLSGEYGNVLNLSNTGNQLKGTFDGAHTGTFSGSGTFSGTHTGTFTGTLQVPAAGARTTCTEGEKGQIYFSTADTLLYFCDGAAWKGVAPPRAAQLQFVPVKIDFDALATRTVAATLLNMGDTAASGLNVAANNGFTAAHDCGSSLAARSACTVTFTLPATGTTVTGQGSASAGGATASVALTGTVYHRSCKELKLAGTTSNGTYTLDPDGPGGGAAIQAYCLMSPSGDGWTLVAKVNGCDSNNLLYPVWTSVVTLGNATDFSLTGGGDVLYAAYDQVAGQEILFYDGGSACGSDNRLLQTGPIMGNKSLRRFLTDLPLVSYTQTSATNFTAPVYRNTACTQPFSPSNVPSGDFYASNALGINIDYTSQSRFSINKHNYDTGVGGSAAADTGWNIGDLDVQGDAVNCWSGHVLTIFVR